MAKPIPQAKVPTDCFIKERAGVTIGERLDVVVLKYDAALSRQNDRLERCVIWFETANWLPPERVGPQ